MAGIAAKTDGPVKTEGQRLLLGSPYSLGQIANLLGVSKQVISYWRQGRQVPTMGLRLRLQAALAIPHEAWMQHPSVFAPQNPVPFEREVCRIRAGLGRGALVPPTTQTAAVSPGPAPLEAPTSPEEVSSSVTEGEAVPLEDRPEKRLPGGPRKKKLKGTTTLGSVDEALEKIRAARAIPNLISTEQARLSDAECRLLTLRHRLEKETDLIEDRIVREHPMWFRIKNALTRVLIQYPDAARAVAAALKELDK